MRICLISVEIFAWGKYGGFGRATRTLGRELVRRGVQVSAVVPKRPGQAEVEELDGITVHGFPPRAPWRAAELYRRCDADVYHSQEPSLGTALARRVMPDRIHIVTCRDTRLLSDWWVEFRQPSASRRQVLSNILYEDNPWVHAAVRRADAVFCAARHLIPKAAAKYRLRRRPGFLPTPVGIPAEVRKADEPTVCFNARWDKRKRPELFFDLAAAFPEVRFLAVGRSRDPAYEAALRRRYAGRPNLEWVGFLDQFASDRLSEILAESWILVNTASREGLPNAFLEAAAHRCAILSAVDPDGFASSFGYHATRDDFDAGLRFLLEENRWRELAERGYRYVHDTFEAERSIAAHLDAYTRAPTRRRRVPL